MTTATKEKKMTNFTANSNKFVSDTHIFAFGRGCYFPTKEMAEHNFNSYNQVGLHFNEINFEGKTWYQMAATNVWN